MYDVAFPCSMIYFTRPTHIPLPCIDQKHTNCVLAYHVHIWPKEGMFCWSLYLSPLPRSHMMLRPFHDISNSLKRHKACTPCIQNAALHATLQLCTNCPTCPPTVMSLNKEPHLITSMIYTLTLTKFRGGERLLKREILEVAAKAWGFLSISDIIFTIHSTSSRFQEENQAPLDLFLKLH